MNIQLTQVFDLPKMPFSQGYAINEICRSVGGRLQLAGMATVENGDDRSFIYLHHHYSKGDVRCVESLWDDDGLSVACVAKRLNGGEWLPSIAPILKAAAV